MSWLEGTRARLRLLTARPAADVRMNEEIAFHIEMETARLARERGLDPDEARRQALVAFGGVERHKEALRDRTDAPRARRRAVGGVAVRMRTRVIPRLSPRRRRAA